MIRKAKQEDIMSIAGIYNGIIEKEELNLLTIGWQKGIYPTAETAQRALDRDELYVMETEGAVVAAAIINKTQVAEYKNCKWQFEASEEEIMVLHTLVVQQEKSKNGYGKKFVEFYEELSRNEGIKSLRMDTNEKNQVARNFYKNMGYREAGIVSCVFNGIEGVNLVCLEKEIR